MEYTISPNTCSDIFCACPVCTYVKKPYDAASSSRSNRRFKRGFTLNNGEHGEDLVY